MLFFSLVLVVASLLQAWGNLRLVARWLLARNILARARVIQNNLTRAMARALQNTLGPEPATESATDRTSVTQEVCGTSANLASAPAISTDTVSHIETSGADEDLRPGLFNYSLLLCVTATGQLLK